MTASTSPEEQLRAKNAELLARLEEAEETLRAIRCGEVEALAVETAGGPQLFTLQGLDAESNRSRGDILAQVSDAVIAVDAEERVTYLNAAAERQYRVSASDTLGRQISEIYTRRWPHAEAEGEMWTAIRKHGEWRGEMIHHTHDDREIAVETSVTALRDAGGAQVGYVRVFHNITERKQAEKRLLESEERTRLATEATAVGIWERNVQTGALRWDTQMFHIYGIDPTADGFVQYSDWRGAVLPEDLPESERILQDTVHTCGQSRREFRIRRRNDSEVRHIEAVETVRTNEHGQAEWVLGTNLDITVRKRSEDELRESQQFTRRVLDNLFAFVGVTTVDGTLTDVNRAPLEAAGIPASEVLGKKFWDCYWWNYSPEIQAQLRDACGRAAGGEIVRYDVPVRMAGDTRVWIDFQIVPLRDAEGRITHLIPSAMEIDERRAAEEELRASEERMAAVNEQLIVSSVRQHELTEAAEKFNVQLLSEITERKKVEEKLRSSERKTKRSLAYAEATLRTTPVPFLVLRADLRVNTASEAFYTDFKVAPAETEGRLIYEIGNGQWNIPKLRELLEEIIPQEHVLNGFEVTHGFATIGTRTMLLNARRMDNAEGVPERILLAIEDITDSVQASQYARSLIEASLDPLVTISAEGKITDVNEGLIKATGIARGKLIGTDFSDYFTEPEKAREGYQQVFSRGFVTDYPLTIRHTDGRLTDVLYNASVYKDVSGNVLGVFAAARDVTAHKQAEEVQSRLGAIISSADDGILSKALDGTVTTWNASAERLFGYTAEEIIGNPNLHLTPHDLLHEEEHILEQILSGKAVEHFETERMTKGGRRLPVSLTVSPIKDAAGNVVGASKIVRDITERKRAEEVLRASQERFRAAAGAVSDIVWTNNAEGRMEGEQYAWGAFTGQRQEDYQGHGWSKAVHPEDAQPTIDAWHLAVAEKRTFEFEHRVRRHDGEWRLCSIRAVPMMDPGGETREWVGVHTDITERKAAEESLRLTVEELARSARAKDDFLAALSHELRTPLTPVLMTASALADDTALPIEVREQISMMRSNIELEARLIDDLLDLTTISRGKLILAPVVTDLHAVLGHTHEIIRSDGQGKKVRIELRLDAKRHHALVDPTRIQQVFWNLLKNAVKFTPGGGSISVSTVNDADDRIVISVRDNGIGMGAEALPHIFNAFEQGAIAGQHRYGGLGLGLAISQAIITAHDGAIRAESEGLNCGSTFTVALLTSDAPAAPASATEEPGAVPTRTLKLLIVEDHEATRQVLQRLLTIKGHQVTTAGTVREALAIHGTERFDAVISDLGLPDGSGLDLMRELQRQRPVPGIALSGYGMEDDLLRTKEAGFFAHLVKPVKVDQLRKLIDQIPPHTHD